MGRGRRSRSIIVNFLLPFGKMDLSGDWREEPARALARSSKIVGKVHSEVSIGHRISVKSSKILGKDHSEVSIGHRISVLKCRDQWTPPSGLFRVFLMILHALEAPEAAFEQK